MELYIERKVCSKANLFGLALHALHSRMRRNSHRETRRHLATSELGHVGQFLRNSILDTSIKLRLTVASATDQTLANQRLMVELLPRATSFGHTDGKPANKGDPAKKCQKLEKIKIHAKQKYRYRENGTW